LRILCYEKTLRSRILNVLRTFSKDFTQTEHNVSIWDNRSRSGQFARGFTLIDLSVVIAIIVSLVSLLLSSVSGDGERARRVKCAGNVRQLLVAMKMYSDDYNGYYPALIMHPPGDFTMGARTYWHKAIEPYLQTLEAKQCPTLEVYPPPPMDDNMSTAYGLNYCGWVWKTAAEWLAPGGEATAGFGFVVPGTLTADGGNPRGGCVRQSMVADPGNFIMLGDNAASNETMSDYQYGTLGPPRFDVGGGEEYSTDMPQRHDAGGNFGFMDGHSKYYKSATLQLPTAKSMWTRAFD